MCLGAPGLGTPCCGSSGVRGLIHQAKRLININHISKTGKSDLLTACSLCRQFGGTVAARESLSVSDVGLFL